MAPETCFVSVTAIDTRVPGGRRRDPGAWHRTCPVRMCEKSKQRSSPGEDGLQPDDQSERSSGDKFAADWRLFRAKLVESESSSTLAVPDLERVQGGGATNRAQDDRLWAHPVSHVEPGCLLVARPECFAAEPDAYFAETVIFILNHGENGTLGLILNKCMAVSLASIPSDTSSPLGEAFHLAKVEMFSNSLLQNGGPMGLDSLMVLHNKSDVPDAIQVIDGVYSGGLMGAMAAVRDGEMESSRVKFFAGYSGWMAGQLDQEIADGTWLVGASSPEYVTDFEQTEFSGKSMWNKLLGQLSDPPND
jgi:putative transcriptional regulator